MEETLFYPAVQDRIGVEVSEHLGVKRVLADMLGTELDDPRFETRLNLLEEEVVHHAREQEEGELFPKVRRVMSSDERFELGSEMLALYEQLLTRRPPDDARELEQSARL